MGNNNFKYLHTMMRVNDLDESINFYSKFFARAVQGALNLLHHNGRF